MNTVHTPKQNDSFPKIQFSLRWLFWIFLGLTIPFAYGHATDVVAGIKLGLLMIVLALYYKVIKHNQGKVVIGILIFLGVVLLSSFYLSWPFDVLFADLKFGIPHWFDAIDFPIWSGVMYFEYVILFNLILFVLLAGMLRIALRYPLGQKYSSCCFLGICLLLLGVIFSYPYVRGTVYYYQLKSIPVNEMAIVLNNAQRVGGIITVRRSFDSSASNSDIVCELNVTEEELAEYLLMLYQDGVFYQNQWPESFLVNPGYWNEIIVLHDDKTYRVATWYSEERPAEVRRLYQELYSRFGAMKISR